MSIEKFFSFPEVRGESPGDGGSQELREGQSEGEREREGLCCSDAVLEGGCT